MVSLCYLLNCDWAYRTQSVPAIHGVCFRKRSRQIQLRRPWRETILGMKRPSDDLVRARHWPTSNFWLPKTFLAGAADRRVTTACR